MNTVSAEKVRRKSRNRRMEYLRIKEDQAVSYQVRLQFLNTQLQESRNRGREDGEQVVSDLLFAIRNTKSKIIRAGREIVRTQSNLPRSKY